MGKAWTEILVWFMMLDHILLAVLRRVENRLDELTDKLNQLVNDGLRVTLQVASTSEDEEEGEGEDEA